MAVYDLKDEKKKKKPLDRRVFGLSLLVVSSLMFLFLLTSLVEPVRFFLLGIFGLFAYPLAIITFIFGLALFNGRKYVMPKRYGVALVFSVFFFLCIIQLIVVGVPGDRTFFQYLGDNYMQQLTAGGLLVGLVSSIMLYTIGAVGAYIVSIIGLIVGGVFVADCIYFSAKQARSSGEVKLQIKGKPSKPESVSVVMTGNREEELNKEAEAAKIKLGLAKPKTVEQKQEEKSSPTRRQIVLTPPALDLEEYFRRSTNQIKEREKEMSRNLQIEEEVINEIKEDISEEVSNFETIQQVEQQEEIETRGDSLLRDIVAEEVKPAPTEFSRDDRLMRGRDRILDGQTSMNIPKPKINEKPAEPRYNYARPSTDLLSTVSVDLADLNDDVVGRRALLENALDTFGIPAKVIGVVVGPAVTRYELEMPPGISVKKIIAHSDDISYALASNGDIRIEAPIPGKSAVGIEVPNDKIATVAIKDILTSKEFNASKSPLTFTLGKDISGAVRICNLQKMPHLLVAGSTGSGKSVCLNSIIISLIYKASPQDVRLILIDPKRVEFTMYEGLPHLLMPTIITDTTKAINAFNWAIEEMERRFMLLQDTKTRNIDEYNEYPDVVNGKKERMPFIVIIVDELADLMMMNKKEIEEKIMRLAQKSRAAGIHLILATQRPSVDVITGTIKANLPSRIAFAVTSFPDSVTILSQGGADKLLGRGDMLYAPSDAAQPKRIQGCFVSGPEVDAVVQYAKDNTPSVFDKAVSESINSPGKSASNLVDDPNGEGRSMELDPLLPKALKMVVENGQASITMIQRRFVVGYPRAAKIIDQMEQANWISASEGSNKPRSVYITMEEYGKLFGEGDNR